MINRPEILISIGNAQEAAIAAQFPIGVLDFKDPEKGALGAVSKSNRDEILSTTPQPPLSAALGELVDLPSVEDSRADPWRWLEVFRYAKIGLAGALQHSQNWQSRWKELNESIPSTISLVGVAYVDRRACNAPAIEEVFELVCSLQAESNFDSSLVGQRKVGQRNVTSGFERSRRERVMLLDTHSKSNGSIVEILGWRQIEFWVNSAKREGITLVVAGSLQREDLKPLVSLAPDFIGFRGAVCEQGRSQLSMQKMHQLFDELSRLKNVHALADGSSNQ